MASRRRMRVSFGSSSARHDKDARGYALEAQRQARQTVKAARAGSCDRALNAFYQAQQHFGASTAELYHIFDDSRMPEHGRAQRWITAATKALRSRCLVKR
jgi:hypothetical protein